MSSWLGGSISSLTGQLTNLTKDILTEGTEEVSDPATELRIAHEKLHQLDQLLTAQRQENERLTKNNRELEEKAEGSELQINTISREYRTVLEGKEKEVNALKHQHQELLEQQARAAAFSASSQPTPPAASAFSSDDHGWDAFDGEQGDWDFDDSIRLQRENNSLRSELHHWKSVAAQLGQNVGPNSTEDKNGADVFDLQHKIKSLETKLAGKAEELQQQAASLHEHHQHKMAVLKSRHQGEINTLQAEVASLEQQLADARDGSSGSQHSGRSVNLPEAERPDVSASETLARLQAALADKKKAEDARIYLESTLKELEAEVESLHDRNHQLENEGKQLIARLTESESKKERLSEEVACLQELLQKQASESLQNAQSQQEDARTKAETALETLSVEGDSPANLTKDLVSTLERENLLLQEQVLKLQEQQALLEKAQSTAATEKARLIDTVATLKIKLKSYTGADEGDSDDTLDTDLSSEISESTNNSQTAALRVTQEEVDQELKSLRAQLTQQTAELADAELEKADWDIERETLEDVVTELRSRVAAQDEEITSLKSASALSSSNDIVAASADEASSDNKLAQLEAEIAGLREEKTELENALEELDSQHAQALEQLIGQRNDLQAKLAEYQAEVARQQAQVVDLNELVGQLREQADKSKSGEESSIPANLAEIADLKEKLQKGGLVINDLHMDKQELQEELRQSKTELALKVEKLKELREEKDQLVQEKREMEQRQEAMQSRLQEAEDELEEWQRRNEEKQVQKLESSGGSGKRSDDGSEEVRARLEAVVKERDEIAQKLSLLEKEKDDFAQELQALERERGDFTQKMLSVGAGGGGAEMMDLSEIQSVEDPVLRSILEGEARVRKQMNEDHKLIGELRQQVQRLYDSKQVLNRELVDLHAFKESTIEKLVDVEGELQDSKTRLDSVAAEKLSLLGRVSSAEKHVEEVAAKLSESEAEKSRLDDECKRLTEQIENQKKHFQLYAQEVKQAQEMGVESLQVEHQQLLDSHTQLKLEIDSLRETATEKERLQSEIYTMVRGNEEMKQKALTMGEELSSVVAHISKLEDACKQKDKEIAGLHEKLSRFDTDLNEIEESVSIQEEKYQKMAAEKDKHLENIKEHRDGLQRSLSQVSLQLEQTVQEKKVLERSLSSQDLKQTFSSPLLSSSSSSELTKLSERNPGDSSEEAISKLETELILRNNVIERLEGELAAAQDMVHRQEQGISDLNDKTAESRKLLDKAEEQVVRQQSTIAVMRQAFLDKELLLEEIQAKLNILVPTLTEQQLMKLQSHVGATELPALEYQTKKAIEFNTSSNQRSTTLKAVEESSVVIQDVTDLLVNGDNVISKEQVVTLEKEIHMLQECLKEKDAVVSELQKSNSSLLTLLEKSSGGAAAHQSLADQVAGHKLEAELRSLRSEKEQMVAVMNEKTRENSTLKSEVHRLMETVSASQSALSKLQGDNQALQQQQEQFQQHGSRQRGGGDDDEDDDMRRLALANMAKLVRDRETEIEALKQKNDTLVAVLQGGGGGGPQEGNSGSQMASLLQEKEQLSQQIQALAAEREQLVAYVTQKHSEAVAYHAEVQRLSGLLSETTAAREKAESDYASLIPSFEDKSQAMVTVQSELVQCKQKLSELEVRHGELLQRSSSHNTSDKSSVASSDVALLEQELSKLRASEFELQTSNAQKDEKLHSLTQKLSVLEEEVAQKDTECAHLRKQVENAKFQLTGLMSEIADVRSDRDNLQGKITAQNSESSGLREQFSQLTTSCRDKDLELTSLREKVTTLTSLVEQGSQACGSNSDDIRVSQLVKENETLSDHVLQLQRERDHQALVAEQLARDGQTMQAEISHWKEKEFKQNKELQRLRQHLIETEDGYTKEALESEEREKSLRNRLAIAEEQLSSSSSHLEVARLETGRQIEHLETQLHQACSQRDAAYSQVTAGQEHTRQLSQSLANLQLVLEQFQREKDSAVAAETERLQGVCHKLREENSALRKELEETRADLADAMEGIEAANRLSEQLDRKEEALAALKEEVYLREQSLHDAEEEIKKLNSSSEAKVDKTLLHNVVMTWLTSPESKRPEIVQLIGNILSFSAEDFQKIDAAQNQGGLLSGIFRRPSAANETASPSKASASGSFSQLFVNFLERESSPPPTPVRLPAERMAAEAQSRGQHHQQSRQPAFNPFTAPRHVRNDTFPGGGDRFSDSILFGDRSSSQQHHLLMSQDSMVGASALFTPVFSSSAARSSESAILKGVLGGDR